MDFQRMFEDLVGIERDMARLATQAAAMGSPPERRDALARLIVAAEGAEVLVGALLTARDQLPFPERWDALQAAASRRVAALRELGARNPNPKVAAIASAAWAVDLTEGPIRHVLAGLEGVAAAAAIERFVRVITEGVADG